MTRDMPRWFWVSAVVASALFIAACSDGPITGEPFGSDYAVPDDLSDGLGGSHPKSVGMDEAPLAAMVNEIRDGQWPNIHSVLVYRSGQLVLEEYFPGVMLSDNVYREFDRDTLHDVFSVSKSILSAAVGMAIESGVIESVDQPVMDFFPEYRHVIDGPAEDLKIRHLLSMTTGLEWDESSASYADGSNSHRQMMEASDPIEFVLSRRSMHTPGEVFTYSTGVSSLLGEIVARATGESYADYMARSLFNPLGIERSNWLPFYHVNLESAGGGLQLRPRDMTKFGVLYLNRGLWQERTIVPGDWVDESTKTQAPGGFYGYQWWLAVTDTEITNLNFFRAAGLGGQHIFVYPELQLVAVFTGNQSGTGPHELWLDYIIASTS